MPDNTQNTSLEQGVALELTKLILVHRPHGTSATDDEILELYTKCRQRTYYAPDQD